MKLTARFFVLILLGSLLYSACTDPTTLGADLFLEDQADISYTDTLTLRASTVRGDSVVTFSARAFTQLNNYLFGRMADPVFGTSTASIYLQPRLESINPDFSQATADSLVLVIPYDTTKLYGNINQHFGMEVYLLAEPFEEGRDYYSNQVVQTEPVPVGSGSFRPSLDTFSVISFNSDGSTRKVSVKPQLRLHLPLTFAQEMLDRPGFTYTSDTLFLNYIRGLYLRPVGETDGMVSFDLSTGDAGMYLYYKNSTGGLRQFHFELNSLSIFYERFEHDYTGSIAQALLNDPQAGKDLVLVQGMAGVRTKIEIPYIQNLQGLAINKAELEISVASVEGDKQVFSPLTDLILLFEENGQLKLVSDLAIASSPSSRLVQKEAFGGVLIKRENGEPDVYRMNISAHLQEMINGRRPNVLYIAAFRRSETAGRSAIIGPGAPAYQMKINVAFTNL